jgi:hypothetical protein
MKRLTSTVLAALLVWGCVSARADVYNWVGPSGGNWNDSANWTGGGGLFPGAGDTAQIDPSLNCAINVNGVQSVGALDFTNAGGLATSGAVYLNSGSLTIGSAASVGSGQTLSGGGAINVPSINLTGGTLAGTLSITGNVNSAGGTVSPGSAGAPGTLNVVGNVILDPNSALNYYLTNPGITGGGVNGFVNIAGDVTLGGSLNLLGLGQCSMGDFTLLSYSGNLTVTGIPHFTPDEPVLNAWTYVGNGSHEIDMTYSDGDPWWIFNHPTAQYLDQIHSRFGQQGWNHWDWNDDGVINQADFLGVLNGYFRTSYGDANLDRATDFADFQILLNHWQNSGAGVGWADGDFNEDGVVDFLDFQILLNYWQPGGWNFAQSELPEPASLSLIVLGGLALFRRKK